MEARTPAAAATKHYGRGGAEDVVEGTGGTGGGGGSLTDTKRPDLCDEVDLGERERRFQNDLASSSSIDKSGLTCVFLAHRRERTLSLSSLGFFRKRPRSDWPFLRASSGPSSMDNSLVRPASSAPGSGLLGAGATGATVGVTVGAAAGDAAGTREGGTEGGTVGATAGAPAGVFERGEADISSRRVPGSRRLVRAGEPALGVPRSDALCDGRGRRALSLDLRARAPSDEVPRPSMASLLRGESRDGDGDATLSIRDVGGTGESGTCICRAMYIGLAGAPWLVCDATVASVTGAAARGPADRGGVA